MTRSEIEEKMLIALEEEFEIENPDKEASLVEAYEFDSVDAINLLGTIEDTFSLDQPLTLAEEREAMTVFMDNCSINQLVEFVETLIQSRKNN